MMFRIGQKVVCVDISGVEDEGLRLKEYTVTASAVCLGRPFIGVDGMSIYNDPSPWRASRFRPIASRKTDISVFRAMLMPVGKKERV
jgi:hypothetical protein